MIRNPYRHVNHHPHHPRRILLVLMSALLPYLVVSDAASGEPFPPVFELASLLPQYGGDGSQGFVLNGIHLDDSSGFSVSSLGDINGDGIDDLIIGAWGADHDGLFDAGESYVVFGRLTGFPAIFELGNLFPAAGGDGRSGFVLKGRHEISNAGYSVSGAGDVNGDGISDLIIGAWGAGAGGESYVIFGRATGFPATFELQSLLPAAGGDGSEGFVLRGVDLGDFSGWSVNGASDVNGDGVDDLIIGAKSARPIFREFAGESYVVFGRTTEFPAAFELKSLFPAAGGDGSSGFIVKGVDSFDYSGWSVGGAGDINGDGFSDVIVGAWEANRQGLNNIGEGYVVFGRNTGLSATLDLRSLFPAAGGDGSEGFVLKGVDASDRSGWSVSGAGDINGDGIDDLAIGAPEASVGGFSEVGHTYVVYGRGAGFPAAFELKSLFPVAGGDGSSGFVLFGNDREDRAGWSVSNAGDINGDGIDDLLVGAKSAGPDPDFYVGASYVVFGRLTGFPAVFELRSLYPAAGGDGSSGFVLKGLNNFDESGYSVSGAGDINGDGIDDLIIGAPSADPNGIRDAGESYVVFGRAE